VISSTSEFDSLLYCLVSLYGRTRNDLETAMCMKLVWTKAFRLTAVPALMRVLSAVMGSIAPVQRSYNELPGLERLYPPSSSQFAPLNQVRDGASSLCRRAIGPSALRCVGRLPTQTPGNVPHRPFVEKA